VKVTGTMDATALPAYLREKLSRDVEVVAPGKKDGGGDKKDKAQETGERRRRMAGARRRRTRPRPPPRRWRRCPWPPPACTRCPRTTGTARTRRLPAATTAPPRRPTTPASTPTPVSITRPPQAYGYGPSHLHAPQMFSNENPNTCSVM